MLDWGGHDDAMDPDINAGIMDFQSGQMFSGGLDIPSDNDVSCMVEEYLTKDVTTLVDEDWASVVDEAIYMITNPDHHLHMSMAGTMNSSSTMASELNFPRMYSEVAQTNSLSGLTHQPQSQLHQNHQQQQQQQLHLNNYDCYQQQQQQQPSIYQHEGPMRLNNNNNNNNNNSMQYLDQQFNQSISLHHDQYMSQPSLASQNNVAYYDNSQALSQQQHVDYFSHISPVYPLSQTVGKIPAPDNNNNNHQTTFNYETYASLPSLNTSNGLQGHARLQSALSRNHSSSSAGNSPSSQSPVSEEDYHEPVLKITAASRRKLEAPVPTKKPKTAAKTRRRKRDPNEPTKPVSAYALFFRDKQANIKGSKPDATFGEVSKIVAQMWDNLDPEKKGMYKKRTEEAKKDYLQQLAVYRASLLSSPDSSMYIQTSFVSRSSPIQMSGYNRPIYPNNNNNNNNNNTNLNQAQHQHPIKTHLQTFPPQSHLSSRSPAHMPQDECLISNEGQMKIENSFGQVYARVMEPDVMKNGYITQMTNLWDAQVVAEGDGLVSHCKDGYTSWMTSQQASNPNTTKVII